jgi:hypothetical protein
MIAEQVKNLLPAEIHSVITIGEPPTDSDSCIALVESGGPHGTYFSGNRMDIPLLKVVARDIDYKRGYAYIKLCKDILASHADAQTLGIVLVNDIMYFGRDVKRRNMFQLTFKIFSNID